MAHNIADALEYITFNRECVARRSVWHKYAYVKAVNARKGPCPINHVKFVYCKTIRSTPVPFEGHLKLVDALKRDWIIQDYVKVETYQKKSTAYKRKKGYAKYMQRKEKGYLEMKKEQLKRR